MEAFWNLEDKLNLSTRGAILILACATVAVVCLCTLIILRRKARKNKIMHQEGVTDENESTTLTECSEASCGCISAKRVSMGPMRWSRASKWEENIGWKSERASPLLGLQRHGLQIGWQSHDSASAVWQRPILKGEKCELPRFSGLILYDEKGKLLRDSDKETNCKETSKQEKVAVTVRTTLKDLLEQ